MVTSDSDIVFQSYGRCCNQDAFFVEFYNRFMGKSEEVRNLFRETDMAAQRHLLRNGIMQLVMHSRGMPATKLKALGESHSRRGFNIEPRWYSLWLDALLETLDQFDPQFSPEIEQSWRRAIGPGIDIIRDSY